MGLYDKRNGMPRERAANNRKEATMADRNKVKLVQALVGAVVLTVLMQGMTLLGMLQYIWMLFLPLLMFFALGADFKKIPDMLIGYAVGELWCVINSLVSGAFGAAFGDNPLLSQLIPTILVIFCILTVHENLFEGQVFSNIPCIFMGMATSFMMLFMQVPITYFHLFGFWCYGLVLAVCLVLSGMAVCSAIFGKERAMAALAPKAPEGK